MKRRILALAAMFLLSAAGAVLADGVVDKLITQQDKLRLQKYGDLRKAALAEAKAGDPAEVAQLNALASKPALSFQGLALTGKWQCRSMQAGGILPVVIYGWFKCRVTDDGSGWKLEKLTGSQRTTGRFYDDGDKRLIYLGSFSVNNDKVKPYGSGPETDQVGYAFRTGPKQWRLELPAPATGSKLDILELKR